MLKNETQNVRMSFHATRPWLPTPSLEQWRIHRRGLHLAASSPKSSPKSQIVVHVGAAALKGVATRSLLILAPPRKGGA